MSGPLPSENKRRRNAPTVPTTNLPAGGRKGRPPNCPYKLGEEGKTWWTWAWARPQAAAWSSGDLYVIARRARLEDTLAKRRQVTGNLGLDEFLSEAMFDGIEEAIENVKALVRALKADASAELALLKEMREIEDRLGLTPKGMAALRWKIVEEETKPASRPGPGRTEQRLRVVDSA